MLSHLEMHHPHIIENLIVLWGSPMCYEYINNLLTMEDDNVTRRGFPSASFAELIMLVEIIKEQLNSPISFNNQFEKKKINDICIKDKCMWHNEPVQK